MIFFQKVRKFITSWTNALNESALREIFLPSSENVNDYVRQGFGCTLRSKIVELKRMKLQKHCWEENQNFKEIKTKFVDRKSRLIPRKIKETMISLKNPKHSFEEGFLKYGFPIYVGS